MKDLHLVYLGLMLLFCGIAGNSFLYFGVDALSVESLTQGKVKKRAKFVYRGSNSPQEMEIRYADLRSPEDIIAQSNETIIALSSLPEPMSAKRPGKEQQHQGSHKTTKYRLTGIWFQNPPSAIVNGKIVEKGDSLGDGARVVDITAETVIYEVGGEEFTLNLEE